MKKQVSNLMLLLTLTAILALVFPVALQAQSGKVNFTGSWTLNAEKSTQSQGGGQRMGGGNFIATQEGNLLTVERTRTNNSGETSTSTMKYTLDGKESVNTNPRGDSKSVAKWSADGKSLTISTSRTFDMNGESRTMKSSEVWNLVDANTLKVVSTRDGQNGEVTTTMVYDKK